MKKIIQGAVLAGALLVLTGCTIGPVNDKRAPGYPGEKTFQLKVDSPAPIGRDHLWITVTKDEWDRCTLGDSYPDCLDR